VKKHVITDGSSESLAFEALIGSWDSFKQAIYTRAFNEGGVEDEEFLSLLSTVDDSLVDMMDSFVRYNGNSA
tara:strand:+ start:1382 stop:1597 length:216 start_codon:yes stop_codon:yes gene_type:complete